MRRNFLELRQFLESRNSKLIGFIDGGNYPPPMQSQYIASASSLFFFGGIALLMAGDAIFTNLGIAEPAFYLMIKENKMTSFGKTPSILSPHPFNNWSRTSFLTQQPWEQSTHNRRL
jgi:hypothetical protein